MFVLVLFVLVLAILGGAISHAHSFFPSIGALSASGAGLLFGALGGALAGGLAYVAWRQIGRALEEDDAGPRALNALLTGLGASLLGMVFYFALGMIFPPSNGVHIAQGAVLAATALIGVQVGYALRTPIWHPSGHGVRTSRSKKRSSTPAKVLDTSVIIDGRVGDLVGTGFVEGEILIPEFVLAELQAVADSSDALRRRKGRRGLEILRRLMEDDTVNSRVIRRDYPGIREVDRKLIHLAHDENAVLVTTDYNLNRVAQVEGVSILNINELANAIKPRFVPGEQLEVEIIDRGAEINQGVGYLDDGTMIVVENGRRHVGRKIRATVKSTLQTDAGRMLFVEPANEIPRWEK